ncbi:hypothetical protein [Micromonospora zhanjiangensis]|uniref:Tetratricopeptide repeat-containing protein n=1 Tax=Micromonospora zhanjiangensis TaxID=1522057 RepID=A0ABV8KHM2_9ACTN
MTAITEAVAQGQAGDRETARRRLTEIWATIGADGDPFHRCVLAHYLADLQDDPADELTWDLRALAAADSLTDERAQRHDSGLSVAGFRPSLHLNLGEDYRKLGDLGRAREHLALAEAAAPVLGDDGYGEMIRSGIARLAESLDAERQNVTGRN